MYCQQTCTVRNFKVLQAGGKYQNVDQHKKMKGAVNDKDVGKIKDLFPYVSSLRKLFKTKICMHM